MPLNLTPKQQSAIDAINGTVKSAEDYIVIAAQLESEGKLPPISNQTGLVLGFMVFAAACEGVGKTDVIDEFIATVRTLVQVNAINAQLAAEAAEALPSDTEPTE